MRNGTARWGAAIVLAIAGAAVGCRPPSGLPVSSAPAPKEYPLRTDWLVAGTPKANPRGWYEPGLPPLLLLNRPHAELSGDAALLLPEVQSQLVLDTRNLKHLEDDPRPSIQRGLLQLFGTPHDPRVGLTPDDIDKLIGERRTESTTAAADRKAELVEEIKELQERRSASERQDRVREELRLDGESLRRGQSLFANYCRQCHGLSGDGNGPGGRFLQPLPRDYRQGKFKFITTAPDRDGVRPNRSDLYRTIERGLDGSAMPSFAALRPSQIQDLVSYVIHLSLRGECEYAVFRMAASKRESQDLIVPAIPNEMFDRLDKLMNIWAKSAHQPVKYDPDPYVTDDDRLSAAARGHRVFSDAGQGGCLACHQGYGRSALFQFDDWGGITRPRDLTAATFRVGRTPEEIYARIYCGIPGVGMPSLSDAMLKPTAEEEAGSANRKWELVHFVRTISDPTLRRKLRDRYGISLEP